MLERERESPLVEMYIASERQILRVEIYIARESERDPALRVAIYIRERERERERERPPRRIEK